MKYNSPFPNTCINDLKILPHHTVKFSCNPASFDSQSQTSTSRHVLLLEHLLSLKPFSPDIFQQTCPSMIHFQLKQQTKHIFMDSDQQNIHANSFLHLCI